MRRLLLISAALIAGSVSNSLAGGQGTILETDTQIIVEYQDDAVVEKPEAIKTGDPDVQPPQQAIKEEKSQNDPRRQKIESRMAQRAAQRQQELEREQMQEATPLQTDLDE